ncbi:ABC transporter ATP-binding protein [Candidatus Altiarchaeota archaeon]
MDNPVIEVEGVSKKYVIYHEASPYKTLREELVKTFKAPFNKGGQKKREVFWALKNVSFDVGQGEIVGLIGRNGAGKSTLLKILSRITTPTEGTIKMRGRIGSLLEVGTGFHPELTGRENIYMNGAVLGMSKREIDEKFDDIVKFSGIEKFLDTPIKRYSSGMYVRLGFSIAANLDPEIMIVDEVLSVGDTAFQKKCLKKIKEVASDGRTVLIVSHNMTAISDLCSRVILLEDGRLVENDNTNVVIDRYLSSISERLRVPIRERTDRTGSGTLRFTDTKLLVDGKEADILKHGQDVVLELSYEAQNRLSPESVRFAVSILTFGGVKFIAFDSATTGFKVEEIQKKGVLRCHIPSLPLIRGHYRGLLYAEVDGETTDRLEDAFEFEVRSGEYPTVGWLSVKHKWELGNS